MHGDAGVVRRIDRRDGRTPVDRRQPAGVAVGQDVHRSGLLRGKGADQTSAMAAQCTVQFDILVADRRRHGPRRLFLLLALQVSKR
jgi:hypothetical protein